MTRIGDCKKEFFKCENCGLNSPTHDKIDGGYRCWRCGRRVQFKYVPKNAPDEKRTRLRCGRRVQFKYVPKNAPDEKRTRLRFKTLCANLKEIIMNIINACLYSCWGLAIISINTGNNWEAFCAASFVLVAFEAHSQQPSRQKSTATD